MSEPANAQAGTRRSAEQRRETEERLAESRRTWLKLLLTALPLLLATLLTVLLAGVLIWG